MSKPVHPLLADRPKSFILPKKTFYYTEEEVRDLCYTVHCDLGCEEVLSEEEFVIWFNAIKKV